VTSLAARGRASLAATRDEAGQGRVSRKIGDVHPKKPMTSLVGEPHRPCGNDWWVGIGNRDEPLDCACRRIEAK